MKIEKKNPRAWDVDASQYFTVPHIVRRTPPESGQSGKSPVESGGSPVEVRWKSGGSPVEVR